MRVSVVVPTRNRHADLASCLESILLCDPFEVIVVDQSDFAAPHLPDDRRIRWLRCPPRGVCVGRNLGIEESTGEIIANTDDDCRVPPDWLLRIREAFEKDPEAALICGRVHLPPDAVGFGAAFEPNQRELRGELPPLGADWGLSANLAVRRSTLAQVGLFDGMLGVGSELRSGGETELILRTLRAGLKVVNAREVDVLHLGVRAPGRDSSRLFRQYAFGTAAALMKHVRLGDAPARSLFFKTLWSSLRRNVLGLFRGRPAGLSGTLWFVFGALASLRKPIDPRTRLYISKPLPPAAAPSVSVVVATRGPTQHVLPCLHSILRSPEVFDLLLVDQSDDPSTREAFASIRDPRARYLHSELRGASDGRNLGIESTRGEVIAFTGDDCRVSPDWIKNLLDVFAVEPKAAAVCGRIVVLEEPARQGYASSFEPKERSHHGQDPSHGDDWDIAANLSLRRSALEKIGPFDARLGPGSLLQAGAETDLLFRVLRAGYKIVHAREVEVVHLGSRDPELRELSLGYAAGTAAALFKHARLGDPIGIHAYLRALASTLWLALKSLATGKRLTGFGSLRAFLKGSFATFHFAVDRRTRMFVERRPAPPQPSAKIAD